MGVERERVEGESIYYNIYFVNTHILKKEYIHIYFMTIAKCISVSREFEDLADKYRISWSEAARVGMAVMLGDLGVVDYDNKINLFRKMTLFKQQAEEALNKIAELEKNAKL